MSGTDFKTLCRQWLQQLAALPEEAMRLSAVAELLADESPAEAVAFLNDLIVQTVRRDPQALAVYGAVARAQRVMQRISEVQLDALVAEGRSQRAVAALQWLLSPSAPRSREKVEAESLIDATLRDLPLGNRRALARRAKGEVLNRLAHDPDPGVVLNLLHNPNVTETVVMGLCARRPTVSRTLEVVLDVPKWSQRYPVRLALVKNPYFDERIAVNLLPLLTEADLSDLRRDESLSESVRIAAALLLELPR